MTTALVLNEKLSKACGDWIEAKLTSNIGANTTLICEDLQRYDDGEDDAFKNWWVYITDYLNTGKDRKVRFYYTSNFTCNVYGAALTADATNTSTIRMHRYPYSDKQVAINKAVEETYPYLHKKVDEHLLRVGNMLPNSHFEDWAVTTYPDKYNNVAEISALSNTACTRGGVRSMKLLASAAGANAYAYITSNTYPRLLDLAGYTVDFECYANPEVVNDAHLEIYTRNYDGATQVLNSSSTALAQNWSLISLTDQTLLGNLDVVEFRWKVKTASKTVVYDDAIVSGRQVYEYLLPSDLQKGDLNQVYVQVSGNEATLSPIDWDRVWNWSIIDDGADKYLRLPALFSTGKRLRLTGIAPLNTVSSGADTINLTGDELHLLMANAKYQLYQMYENPISAEDISRYERASAKAYGEYMRLKTQLGMGKPSTTMKFGGW